MKPEKAGQKAEADRFPEFQRVLADDRKAIGQRPIQLIIPVDETVVFGWEAPPHARINIPEESISNIPEHHRDENAGPVLDNPRVG